MSEACLLAMRDEKGVGKAVADILPRAEGNSSAGLQGLRRFPRCLLGGCHPSFGPNARTRCSALQDTPIADSLNVPECSDQWPARILVPGELPPMRCQSDVIVGVENSDNPDVVFGGVLRERHQKRKVRKRALAGHRAPPMTIWTCVKSSVQRNDRFLCTAVHPTLQARQLLKARDSLGDPLPE